MSENILAAPLDTVDPLTRGAFEFGRMLRMRAARSIDNHAFDDWAHGIAAQFSADGFDLRQFRHRLYFGSHRVFVRKPPA